MSGEAGAEHALDVVYSAHAQVVVNERGIDESWIAQAIEAPDDTRPDASDPALVHYYRTIPEFGGRHLCVVVNVQALPRRIVTVFFDRRRRRQVRSSE